MAVRHYKELRVWQKAMDLVEVIYRLTREFPKEEIYCLTKQMRRAVVSVPSNIAEGQGRTSTGEFRQFLGTARGSLFEVESQLYIACRLGYIEESKAQAAVTMINDLSRMLQGLITALPDRRAAGMVREPRATNHEPR